MPAQMTGGGGSFLGTPAPAAVGMIRGSLLFNGIRHLIGRGHPAAVGGDDPRGEARSPWGGDASRGDLARQAGLDKIGTDGGGRLAGDDGTRMAGLFDGNPSDDDSDDLSDDDLAASDFDDGGTSDA